MREHAPVGGFESIHFFGYTGEERLGIVVTLVDRNPGERANVSIGPLRQQRGLSVPASAATDASGAEFSAIDRSIRDPSILRNGSSR
jgi:hypothetical protein